MKRKRKIAFIIEAVVVFVLIAVLASIAVPQIGQMIKNDQEELRARELADIQGAVAEMMADSPSGTLQPIGPTRDMGQVKTNDATPLVLTDYLRDNGDFVIKSDCYYTLFSDGIVTQDCSYTD